MGRWNPGRLLEVLDPHRRIQLDYFADLMIIYYDGDLV